MKRLGLALALLVGLAMLSAAPTWAGGLNIGIHSGHGFHHGFKHPGHFHGFKHHHGFHHHKFHGGFHRHHHKFGPPGIVTGPFFPVVVSVPPALVAAEPVVLAPPSVVSVAPALPTPILIEYPTGWYQLRGDGGRAPYQWVWIPKPPPPPPSEAPPTVPPASPSPVPANPPTKPSVEPRSSPVPRALYRWTDEHGVVHLTESREDIPERHRSMAQRGGWSMEPVTLRLRH